MGLVFETWTKLPRKTVREAKEVITIKGLPKSRYENRSLFVHR